MGRIIFVTGTDTGVGKTLVTALLLHHLRERGVDALAMKPFCTGDRRDICLLERLQDNQLTREEVNPFFFPEPVAPLVAARHCARVVRLRDVLSRIHRAGRRCECLIIEGAGGLMTPLGERFCATALIEYLRCVVIVVAANKLGTINHTLLTLSALRPLRRREVKIVLSQSRRGDRSALSNAGALREWFPAVDVLELPFLGGNPCTVPAVRRNGKNLKKLLARILASAKFTPVLSKRGCERAAAKKAVDSLRCGQ